MECMRCGAQWVLREGQTKLANCPFCGKSLMIESTQEKYIDFIEALRAIVEMKGTDYLVQKPQNVLGIFLDITKNLQREYRLLKLFYDNGTEKFFEDSTKATEGQLNVAVRNLQENAFMDAGSARKIVNIFADVLGIKAQVQEPADRTASGGQIASQKPTMKAAFEKEDKTVSFQEEKKVVPIPEGMIFAEHIRANVVVELEQNIYQIVEVQQVRPGKGAAFVRAKLKNVRTGGLIEKVFRPTEMLLLAKIDRKKMQYLYSNGSCHTFFDPETYTSLDLDDEIVGNTLKFVAENEMVTVCSYGGRAFLVEPPLFVERKVTSTAPGYKGDTSRDAVKPATIETGAVIQVPLFVERGNTIKIETRTGEYLCRV